MRVIIINPQRACAARVTVLCLYVCLYTFLSFDNGIRQNIMLPDVVMNSMWYTWLGVYKQPRCRL